METQLNLLSDFYPTIILISQIIAIISAGVLGGIINYYLENDNQITDKKKRSYQIRRHVYLGIGAAFLIPLFLWMTQSEIRTSIKTDSSSFLVFVGFCLVAAMSAQKFIQALSNRILKDVKEIKKRTDELEENIDKKSVNDARILAMVDNQLEEGKISDKVNTKKIIDDFIKKISSASRSNRITIFEKTRKFRRKAAEDSNKQIENANPIFRGLILGDKENKFHRNHAQLSYIQKDKIPPDYKAAIIELDLAIEKRNKEKVAGFQIYEFNRALCRIKIDADFAEKKPSSKGDKNRILDDLRFAATSKYWKNAILKSAEDNRSTCISDWMKNNKITNKDVTG